MKRATLVLAVVGLVVLGGIGLVIAWPRAPLDATLLGAPAAPARLVCHGYVDCRHGPLVLLPTRAGRVVQLFVREGQTVSKDAPLLQLDDRLVKRYEEEAALAVQAARLKVVQAQNGQKQYQAKHAQAVAALQLAEDRQRAAEHFLSVKQDLYKDGVGNPGLLQLARDQVNDAKSLVTVEQNKLAELNAVDPKLDLKLAQLQVERSEAQLRRAGEEREELLLKAPAAATILRLAVQEGDLVGPTAPRPALLLAPVGEWVVRGEVSQEFADRVRAGLPVQVEDEGSSALLATGQVAEVADSFLPRRQMSAEATAINTGLVLECVITLAQGHAPLRFGQRVRVRFLAER